MPVIINTGQTYSAALVAMKELNKGKNIPVQTGTKVLLISELRFINVFSRGTETALNQGS
jgi:hypothetical protein